MQNNKRQGLLGIDALRMDKSTLVNSMKSVEPGISFFRGYEVSIRLKESSQSVYFHARKAPVSVLPFMFAMLNKMAEEEALTRKSQAK